MKRLARCAMPVRPTSAREYPCPRPAKKWGMCFHHADVVEKKFAPIFKMKKRKVRKDKGIARPRVALQI